MFFFDGESVTWKNIKEDLLIECRGPATAASPWFKYLPFEITNGEIIRFESELKIDSVHRSVKVVQTNDQKFICGATYSWEDVNNIPTLEGVHELTQQVNKFITVPYKITSHQAALRPATKDRRPYLGRHPEIHQLAIFNGFGSKGVMMGPLLAQQLASHLLHHTPLDHEVDISRIPFL